MDVEDEESNIVSLLRISEDMIYTISHDGITRVYSFGPELNLESENKISNRSLLQLEVDERYLYIYIIASDLIVLNKSDFSNVKTFENVSSGLFQLAIDDNRIYGMNLTNMMTVWDKSDFSAVSSFEPTSDIETDAGALMPQAIYVDDQFIYTAFINDLGTNEAWLRILNKTDFTVYSDTKTVGRIYSLEADSDHLYVVFNEMGKVEVYSKPDFTLVDTIVYDPLERPSFAVSYDNRLYVASLNGTVGIWDTSDFSLILTIGEPMPMQSPRYIQTLEIQPLPLILALALILVLNVFGPERFRSRFKTISLRDILTIVLVTGLILLLVGIFNPSMISTKFTVFMLPSQYFDVFVRSGAFGYYWFVLWAAVGYLIGDVVVPRVFKRKHRKTSSLISVIFLVVAYILFLFIP
jgi:hypothetical protein